MNLKKISKISLIVFMALQPIFDIYYLYTDKIISLFKFSPATILRMIFLFLLFISSIYLYKDKLKIKNLVIFISIYLVYTLLHLYNATLFSTSILRFQNYSFFKEVFYLIRMLCPLLLVFITKENKLEYKDVRKIILSVYLIFSVIMVVTNFLCIARTSYFLEDTKTILVNFFGWFKPGIYQKYTYEYFASKGLFGYANQLSGVMTSLFPLLVYIVLKDKFKIINIVTLFLTMLAMMMLGTRIASAGMLAVFVACMILYVFFKVITKDKKIITLNFLFCIIFFILSAAIYKYSPVANRTYADDNHKEIEEKIDNIDKLDIFKLEIKELENSINSSNKEEVMEEIKTKKINFLKENFEDYFLSEQFFYELYPYQEDPDFWLYMLEVPYNERSDNREIKTHITKRVFELNNNKLDYIAGMSFSRPMNADIYMENDIITQFYSLGILGLILFIMPYLGIVIYVFVMILKNKKNFNFLNLTYIMCILLVYLIGYLAGNTFDEWIVTLFLGFVTGLLISNVKKS